MSKPEKFLLCLFVMILLKETPHPSINEWLPLVGGVVGGLFTMWGSGES